ncbi:MAG: hypothetical protein QXH37_08270 [Candidatus Bathyarchaeia archaeon]
MKGSWGTVLVATAFNLLFEYSMRGVNNFLVQPVLPFILFTIYFTLYTMLDDMIARYRLRDIHLMVIAFFHGTAYQFLVSGTALLPPLILGVNWLNLLFVIMVWWGVLQSVVTFYIANRIAPRDWTHKLSKKGWVVALSLNALMILMFQSSGVIPKVNIVQIFWMVVIMTGSAAMLKAMISKAKGRDHHMLFNRSLVLDVLCILTASIFLFCAFFLTFDPIKINTSNVNATSTAIVVRWSIILALALLGYRLLSKKSISV